MPRGSTCIDLILPEFSFTLLILINLPVERGVEMTGGDLGRKEEDGVVISNFVLTLLLLTGTV